MLAFKSIGLPWWLSRKESAVQEVQVRSLGWEDPLELDMATHSSILAWKIPRIEDLHELQSIRLQNWTQLCN